MSPDAEKSVTQGELSALRELIDEKFRGVKWQIALALVGGQTVAALVTSRVGGPTPTQTVAYARHLLGL